MYRFAYRMRTALLTQRAYLPCVRCFSFASAQSEAPGRSGTEKSAPSSQAGSVLQGYDQALDEVAERAMLSVVEIKVSGYGPREDDTSGQGIERQRAVGSGVMVSADGYIITKLPTITWWLVHSGSESSFGDCYCGTRHLPHQPRPPATSLRSPADRCQPKSGSCLDQDRGKVSSVYCAARAVPRAAWTDWPGDRISRGIGSHRHQGDRERGGTTAGNGPSHGVRTN